MKILLVDDHAMLRGGLKLVLAEAFLSVEFGEAGNSQQALAAAVAQPWDLIVLDISMLGQSGLEVLVEIHARCPTIPVLMLSMFTERQYAVRALQAGASGYLTKASAGTELVRAIEHILAGGRYVSAELAEQLASVMGRGAKGQLHEHLSNRELEILRLIAAGKTLKEMVALLVLSGNTISTYRARLLDKMKMRTNAELTHYAILNRLVE
ncbi:MAG: response regulator transcription factor [Verrucomicrobiota bacterium]